MQRKIPKYNDLSLKRSIQNSKMQSPLSKLMIKQKEIVPEDGIEDEPYMSTLKRANDLDQVEKKDVSQINIAAEMNEYLEDDVALHFDGRQGKPIKPKYKIHEKLHENN